MITPGPGLAAPSSGLSNYSSVIIQPLHNFALPKNFTAKGPQDYPPLADIRTKRANIGNNAGAGLDGCRSIISIKYDRSLVVGDRKVGLTEDLCEKEALLKLTPVMNVNGLGLSKRPKTVRHKNCSVSTLVTIMSIMSQTYMCMEKNYKISSKKKATPACYWHMVDCAGTYKIFINYEYYEHRGSRKRGQKRRRYRKRHRRFSTPTPTPQPVDRPVLLGIRRKKKSFVSVKGSRYVLNDNHKAGKPLNRIYQFNVVPCRCSQSGSPSHRPPISPSPPASPATRRPPKQSSILRNPGPRNSRCKKGRRWRPCRRIKQKSGSTKPPSKDPWLSPLHMSQRRKRHRMPS